MAKNVIETIQAYVNDEHERHDVCDTQAHIRYRNVCCAIAEIKQMETTVQDLGDDETTSVELFGRRFIPLPLDAGGKSIDFYDVMYGSKYGGEYDKPQEPFTVGRLTAYPDGWFIAEEYDTEAFVPKRLEHYETENQKIERLLSEFLNEAGTTSRAEVAQMVSDYASKLALKDESQSADASHDA